MTKKTTVFLILIICTGLLIRIAYFYHISGQPDFKHLIIDPQFNDYWAHKILHKGNYPSPTGTDPMIENTSYGRPPAYPFLLAFIYYFFGDNYTSPRIIQFLLGTINILLIFLCISRIFKDTTAGLISALLIAIIWEPIYFEGEINYPVWVITLVIILIGASIKYLQTNKIKYIVYIGILLGIFSLFRPNALLLLPLYIITIFLTTSKQKAKNILFHCVILVISTLLIISPVLIRNYKVSKEFFLISCFGGINTYIGNNSKSTGDSPTVPDIIHLCGVDNWDCFNYRLLVKGLGIKQKGRPYSFKEASQFFYKKSMEFWNEQPFSAIKLTLRKLLLFWGPAIVSDGKVIYYDRESSILKILPGFPILSALLFFSLFLFIYLWERLSKETKKHILFLFTWSFIYSFSVIPFFVSERYRVPVLPPLCMISSLGISFYLKENQNLNQKQKLIILSACPLCFILIYILPVRYQPDQSRWYYHKAIVSYKANREQDAMNYAKKSISLNPKYSEVYAFLGIISLNQNQLKEAEDYNIKALEINPDYAMANNNLGYVMELQGQIDLAQKYYQKACELSPVYYLAWINLGRIYLYHKNDLELAENSFLKATELEPNMWSGWFHLGNLYIQKKDYFLAEKYLTKSLLLSPNNVLILNNLGFLYIQDNQYEKAISLLKKALEQESTFIDAMFNLGNAFKETNNLKEAEYWYKKILEINPQFTEAEEKLIEISETKDNQLN